MSTRLVKFEEEYFKGDKSKYTTCYDYKVGNIIQTYNERVLEIFKKNVPKNAKILDAGCAFGDLLALLDNNNYQTYGIDISKYALEKARKITKAQLLLGDLNDTLPYTSNFFDVIFALDIIEHLESPYKFLLELRRVLKMGGILFIQTPNINSIFERFTKDMWFGYRDETHLYLFNRKNIKFLLEKSGYSIFCNQTISAPFPYFIRSLVKNTDIGGNLWVVARKI
jgi:2-polyprenyl-3-methyl-5-hydroxy-6-metoxy-1,4-benzoquinol methylase